MNYINFSKSYHVRMLIERDIPLILALCEKDTQFYEHCPPFVLRKAFGMICVPCRSAKWTNLRISIISDFLMMPSSLWL